MIPFVDIKEKSNKLNAKINNEVIRIINDKQFILGPEVLKLEKSFQKIFKVNNVSLVANGTDAITIALESLNLPEESEVITTSFTAFATVQGIMNAGFKPVFADINLDDFNINPSSIKKIITKKTKVIIPVHIFGFPSNMTLIAEIAKKYNLKIIEDCAQSIFAKHNDKFTGTFGDLAAFSFYPTKNLGAYGDAGMIITNNLKLDKKIKILRNQGMNLNQSHQILGRNSRCDTIQAVILSKKLESYKKNISDRHKIFKIYKKNLKNIKEIKLIKESKLNKSVYHQFTILAKDRNKLCKFLYQSGINTQIFYKKPVFMQKAVINLFNKKYLNYKVNDICKICLSLPIYPALTEKNAIYICNKIKEFYE